MDADAGDDDSLLTGTLRDLARFGELTRNNGKVIDNLGTCEKVVEEVIAESIVLDSKSNGDFTKAKLTRGVPAKCSEIANAPPLNNWLKAIGKCDQDQDECNNDTGTETNSGQSSMITKKESKNLVDSYSRKGSGV
ncbi:hypothetical protein THAOC_20450, partial [Thalassiosira oceanica]